MEATPGIAFKETMQGPFSLEAHDPREGESLGKRQGMQLAMHVEVRIDDLDRFIEDPEHRGTLAGRIDFTPWGSGIPTGEGVFNLFSPSDDPRTKLMVYELPFTHGGEAYYLAGRKEVRDDPGFDLWSDTTTLYTRLFRGNGQEGTPIGAGVLKLDLSAFLKVMASVRALEPASPAESAKRIGRFGHFFAGELWKSYGPLASR